MDDLEWFVVSETGLFEQLDRWIAAFDGHLDGSGFRCFGDVCEGDLDSDGVLDDVDTCPLAANADQAITPCISLFDTVTYTRATNDVLVTDGAVLAATEGGVLVVDADVSRLDSGDGLISNRVLSIATDDAGNRYYVSENGLSLQRAG